MKIFFYHILKLFKRQSKMEEYLKHIQPEEIVRLLDKQIYNLVVAAERDSKCEAGMGDAVYELMTLRNAFAYECDNPKKLMFQ